jgi:HEPN domain-containing protein
MSVINKDATRWLKQASDDMITAEILLESARYGPCAFFCQQAAEKALKSVLYAVGERPWGHSIPSLLDQAAVVLGVDAKDAPVSEVEALDEHYMRPRYPDAQPEVTAEYDRATAESALEHARTVMAFAQKGIADVGRTPDNTTISDVG